MDKTPECDGRMDWQNSSGNYSGLHCEQCGRTLKICPIICNILEAVWERMKVSIIGSGIWAFHWNWDWWPSVTLNSVMAIILHYFMECGTFGDSYIKPYEARPIMLWEKCSQKIVVFVIDDCWSAHLHWFFFPKTDLPNRIAIQLVQYYVNISAAGELLQLMS